MMQELLQTSEWRFFWNSSSSLRVWIRFSPSTLLSISSCSCFLASPKLVSSYGSTGRVLPFTQAERRNMMVQQVSPYCWFLVVPQSRKPILKLKLANWKIEPRCDSWFRTETPVGVYLGNLALQIPVFHLQVSLLSQGRRQGGILRVQQSLQVFEPLQRSCQVWLLLGVPVQTAWLSHRGYSTEQII